ncbi:MAG: heme exporter protein CcmB [Roseovarius sp.]|nr:heme exporter protein CcmB [Roseovarius sp.]
MGALVSRDLKLAVRAGGGFGLGVAFFLILVSMVSFGVGPQGDLLSRISTGMLWVGAILSCLLSLDRIFALDWEDGSLELLATSPLPLELVVLAKALVHWLTTGLPLVFASPIFGALLNLEGPGYIAIAFSLLVGTPALSMIGAFGAALTVGIKRGGLLLSLLVLPFYVPTLIFGALMARTGANGSDYTSYLLLLSGITCGTIALLPFAAAAVLKINLR